MRIATFNLESLDLPPKAPVSIAARADVLQPALERLAADILCLQEVNAQHVTGQPTRKLAALDALLAGTRYAGYHRAVSAGPEGRSAADVHNLVTLSRLPIRTHRDVRHEFVPPVLYALQTDVSAQAGSQPVRFERSLLLTEHETTDGGALTVINLHLRAPLATNIASQKLSPFVWKSVGGWAEGYFLSAIKRAGQALELRLLLDRMLAEAPHLRVAAAGDFNAEDHETPLKIVAGVPEDTGNGLLGGQSLVVLDRAVPADRRWSVMHHGRPQMLDHILASHALLGAFRSIEVHNEAIGDEAIGYGKGSTALGSYHAAVVAEFALA